MKRRKTRKRAESVNLRQFNEKSWAQKLLHDTMIYLEEWEEKEAAAGKEKFSRDDNSKKYFLILTVFRNLNLKI